MGVNQSLQKGLAEGPLCCITTSVYRYSDKRLRHTIFHFSKGSAPQILGQTDKFSRRTSVSRRDQGNRAGSTTCLRMRAASERIIIRL